MNKGYAHTSPCRECGVTVYTEASKGTRVLCDDCKKELIAERSRKYYKYTPAVKDELIIVKDPDPLGFKKGAVITKEQMKCMCRSSIHSFTVGTELKDYTGTLYRVIALPDESQKLILI